MNSRNKGKSSLVIAMFSAAIVSIFALGIPRVLYAGQVTGKLVRMTVDRNVNAIVLKVQYASNYDGKPACSNDSNWDFSIGDGTSKAKELYALALVLYTTGNSATFYGTGNCNEGYGRVESLFYLTSPPL